MSKDVGIVPNLSTIVPKTSRRLGVPNGGCSILRGWGPIVDQKVGVFQKIGNDCAKHCVCRRGSHLSDSGGSGAGGVGAGRKNAQPVGAGRGAAGSVGLHVQVDRVWVKLDYKVRVAFGVSDQCRV